MESFIFPCIDIKVAKKILSQCTPREYTVDGIIFHNKNNVRIAKECHRPAKNPAIMAWRIGVLIRQKVTEVIVHARASITSSFAQKAKAIKMATGGNVPELGGYDYEFTSKVAEDWECLVCHLPLKYPVQIVGCGHRLCNICMESLLR